MVFLLPCFGFVWAAAIGQSNCLYVAGCIVFDPFVVLGIAIGLRAVWWERYHQGTSHAVFPFLSPIERILVASRAVSFYLSKIFWPSNLTFIYPRWNISPAHLLDYIWLLLGIAGCAAIYFLRQY